MNCSDDVSIVRNKNLPVTFAPPSASKSVSDCCFESPLCKTAAVSPGWTGAKVVSATAGSSATVGGGVFWATGTDGGGATTEPAPENATGFDVGTFTSSSVVDSVKSPFTDGARLTASGSVLLEPGSNTCSLGSLRVTIAALTDALATAGTAGSTAITFFADSRNESCRFQTGMFANFACSAFCCSSCFFARAASCARLLACLPIISRFHAGKEESTVAVISCSILFCDATFFNCFCKANVPGAS